MGAPRGLRQAGVGTPTPKAADPEPAPKAPAGAERAAPPEKTLPAARKAAKAPPKATPNATPSKASGDKSAKATAKSAAAPKAGAGAVGGKGADVANVKTEGIAFPFPGYLNNIVRQLTLNWTPRRVSASLVTEIKFLIRRDGSVSGIEIVKSSGDRLYDIEATGAVEAVGTTRSFGALPSGWKDDVLVVYFTFDYSLRP
jgi:protein TonB